MILVATPIVISPPNGGSKMRIYTLLQTLKQSNIPFHIAYIGTEEDGVSEMISEWGESNVTIVTWRFTEKFLIKNYIRNFLKRICIFERHFMNLSIDDFENSRTKRIWNSLLKEIEPKTVLIEYVQLSWLLKNINPAIHKVIDTHDVFTERNLRTKLQGFDSNWISYLSSEEKRGLLRADKIIAIQDLEADFFSKNLGLERNIEIVGHIVNMPIFILPTVSCNIGFFASSTSYNVLSFEWFLKNVWQEVYRITPNVKLYVGGTICTVFDKPIEGIEYLGIIESVSDFYSRCSFTINPVSSGTGLKIKTIESLIHGRPVIATPVAAEGLSMFLNKGLTVSDSKDSFIKTILSYAGSLNKCEKEALLSYKTSEKYQHTNRENFFRALNIKRVDEFTLNM